MKKLLVVLGMTALSLFICKAVFAETVGNSIDINIPAGKGVYSSQLSDFITLNAGFDAEFLTERKFKYDSTYTTKAPELAGNYYMARVSSTLFNRVQPYVKFGYSDLEMSWQDANGNVKVDADPAFAWGVGLKAYLWEFEGMGLKIFSTGSYRATEPSKVKINTDGVTGSVTSKKFQVYEKQATLGMSKEIKLAYNASLVPYAGVAWSDTTARVRVTQNSNVMNSGAKEPKDNLGVFFGTEFLFMDNFSLNLEARLIDQTAISTGFTALF